MKPERQWTMRYAMILTRHALPLALLPVLLLTACGTDRPALALPPVERAEPVAFPAVPEGAAVCDGSPCLSDAQVGELMADLAAALDQANARLLWLRDWIAAAGQ